MPNVSTFVQHKPPLRNQQGRKIPPKPPIRRQTAIRHEPEGMAHVQFAASFQEKKTFQLAVVQKLAREPIKPPAPLSSIHFNQQHLLNPQLQTVPFLPPPPSFVPNHQQRNNLVFGIHNSHQNFNNFHQQQQMFLHPQLKQQQLVIAGMQMRMSVMRNRHNVETHGSSGGGGGGSSGSDPENHIYEMIDEHEADSQSKLLANQPTQLLQQPKVQIEEPPKAPENLFQKMLRAEMTNQIQLCKNNGFLSHLPQEKRMDIIQETALSLATEAYVEK